MRRVAHRYVVGMLVSTVVATLFAEPVFAHAGSLQLGGEPAPVPLWLVLLTGGGAVGASFMLTSLVTDHQFIDDLASWNASLPTPDTVRSAIRWLVAGVGVLALVSVIVVGVVGPTTPTLNFALLLVWAGWWAGYTMTVYVVGDTWPALNPWRTIAGVLPRIDRRTLPDRLGRWPAVVGLLVLVWLEVTSSVGTNPEILAGVVVVYTLVTLAGAVVYGRDVWFGSVDPVSLVFEWYGRLAPFEWIGSRPAIRTPGSALVESDASKSDVAFIIALLWVTTYDGAVSTGAWADFARAVVGVGVPPTLLYAATLVIGFLAFRWVFTIASRRVRRSANTYVAAETIERRFAPSLLPIAAGYHLAHFVGYFLSLAPALVAVATNPLAPPADVVVIVLPDWFGSIQLAAILLGHIFAVMVAHAIAFELFTGRLQPIRSQYPFIVVMVFYTMTSIWIVTQPFVPPPYV